jgi:hypothetical protein
MPLRDSPRGYHPPSSLCLGTDMVYKIDLLLKLLFLINVIIPKIKVLLIQT